MGEWKHGYSNTRKGERSPTYAAWVGMIRRCTKPQADDFVYYGGRGIRVCGRWLDFRNFLADMGDRPDGMSIDRIDNNGNYEPTNCRWITHKEQCNNRRSTKLVTFNGETRSLSEWSRLLGMTKHGIQGRLKKGWSIEDAISTPKLRQGAYRDGSGGRTP